MLAFVYACVRIRLYILHHDRNRQQKLELVLSLCTLYLRATTLRSVTRQKQLVTLILLPVFSVLAGYGFTVRNMAEASIRVTGKVSIHRPEYPCNLRRDCCAEESKCCPTNYRMPFGTLTNVCAACPRFYEPGQCHIHDHYSIPEWSSRGPARSNYNLNLVRGFHYCFCTFIYSMIACADCFFKINT